MSRVTLGALSPNVAIESTVLQLKNFGPKVVVEFGAVHMTTACTRTLLLENSTLETIFVNIDTITDKMGFSIIGAEHVYTVAPGTASSLKVQWCPPESDRVAYSGKIRFKMNGRFGLEVTLLGTAVPPKKSVTKADAGARRQKLVKNSAFFKKEADHSCDPVLDLKLQSAEVLSEQERVFTEFLNHILATKSSKPAWLHSCAYLSGIECWREQHIVGEQWRSNPRRGMVAVREAILSGRISFKADLDVCRDVRLRENFCELFLSHFNLHCLNFALRCLTPTPAVRGQAVQLPSDDAAALRLAFERYALLNVSCYQSNPLLHVLTRAVELLAFLDHAAQHGLFPLVFGCLFRTDSPARSTKDIVKMFSNSFLQVKCTLCIAMTTHALTPACCRKATSSGIAAFSA
jgi:hypothetical protein